MKKKRLGMLNCSKVCHFLLLNSNIWSFSHVSYGMSFVPGNSLWEITRSQIALAVSNANSQSKTVPEQDGSRESREQPTPSNRHVLNVSNRHST